MLTTWRRQLRRNNIQQKPNSVYLQTSKTQRLQKSKESPTSLQLGSQTTQP
jgi:hypothetical protein